jgi:hypothetical protein
MKQRFFALKYVRLLTKTAAAQELGAPTCWLLSLVACQEDVKGFTEPAKFYFAQLMPLCGFGSPKQLRNAIAKAVETGWLDYSPGSKGIPGRFSVRVPLKFAELAPFGCDESSERVPPAETQTETQVSMGALSGNESTANRQRKRKRNGNTSLPITTSTPIQSANAVSVWGKCPEGVDQQHWQDWLTVRKKKRATNTETAWTKFNSEVAKSGRPIGEIVQLCAENGWSGFQADWLTNDRSAKANTTGSKIPEKQPYVRPPREVAS